MTAAEMNKYIGRRGTIRTNDTLKFFVEIIDVKERWGFLRYEVKPVSGWGKSWVENVTFTEEPVVSLSEILERR